MTPLPHDPGPHWGEVGIHGLHRAKRWDAVSLATVPGIEGDDAWFVVLPDGTVVSDLGDGAGALARSVELPAPYRAEARRRAGHTWAVGATAIEVAEVAGAGSHEEIEVVWDGRERSVRVDGEPTLVSFPELEALAVAREGAWVVRASRLAGRTFEVTVGAL